METRSGTFQALNARGYGPVELTSVLYREILPDWELPYASSRELTVRLTEEPDRELYVETSVQGWGESAEVSY